MNTQLFTALINALNNLDDAQGAQLLSIASGMTSMATPVATAPVQTAPAKKLHLPDEEKPAMIPLNIEGTKLFDDDFVVVTQVGKGKSAQYRLYITCKIGGDNGKRIRTAIKLGAKEQYGCKWAGEYGTGNIFWAFPDGKTAKQYAADRDKANKERETV